MNADQMAQQIKHELQLVTWGAGTDAVVFGVRGVHVFAGTPTEEQIPAGFPWALVSVDDATADEEDSDLWEQPFTIMSAAEVAGDPLGEHGLIGGSVADLGKSVGRGVLELAPRIQAAVGKLTGADGCKIIVSAARMGSPTPLGAGRHIVLMEHTVTAYCVAQLHYAAPQNVKNTAGTLAWEGAHCSDRFDFLQYRVVRKTGTTPSTDPSDGTVVYTGTAATTTGASSGNVYTVFADYNARGGAAIEASSEPWVGAYKVVV